MVERFEEANLGSALPNLVERKDSTPVALQNLLRAHDLESLIAFV